jgi:hypothetical protein
MTIDQCKPAISLHFHLHLSQLSKKQLFRAKNCKTLNATLLYPHGDEPASVC